MRVKNTTRRHRVAEAKYKRSLSHLAKQGRRSNPFHNTEEHESCHENCQARR